MLLELAAAAAAAATPPAGPPPPRTAPHTEGHPPPGIADPRTTIPYFDVARLEPLLDELGVAHERRANSAGEPFLAAAVGDRVSFNIVPTACLNSDHSRCIGVNFIVLYAGVFNRETVAAFNQRHAFTSAGVIGAGEGAYLLRYEIADYGVPRGNVAASLAAFLHFADAFRETLRGGATTVSARGYAGDLAAGSLNAQGLAALAGAPAPAARTADELAASLLASDAPVNPLR